MKNLAVLSLLVAVITFALGILAKLGIVPALPIEVSPIGFVKATIVFLLIGINLELLALLKK